MVYSFLVVYYCLASNDLILLSKATKDLFFSIFKTHISFRFSFFFHHCTPMVHVSDWGKLYVPLLDTHTISIWRFVPGPFGSVVYFADASLPCLQYSYHFPILISNRPQSPNLQFVPSPNLISEFCAFLFFASTK